MWILGLKGLYIHFKYLPKSCRFTWSGEGSVYTLGQLSFFSVRVMQRLLAPKFHGDVEG